MTSETPPREFMERAFAGRRQQIVGDCVQLNTDVESYNENSSKENPIPLLLDFRDDVAEARGGEQTDQVGPAADPELELFEGNPFDAVRLPPAAPITKFGKNDILSNPTQGSLALS